MSILATLDESVILNRLQGASGTVVKNGFFANYLASLLLLRIQDLNGLLLINDPSHSKLTSFGDNMSDLNFWGKALFYPSDPAVRNRLLPGHSTILHKSSSMIDPTRIQSTLNHALTSPHAINWEEVTAALMLYKSRFEIQSSYFDNINRAVFNWDKMSETSKKKAMYDSFMYLMQSDPQSALLPRLRELANQTMISKVGGVAMTVIGFNRINEDEGGGGEGGGTSTGNIASNSSNAIMNPPTMNPDSGCNNKNDFGGLYKLSKLAPKQVTKKGRFTVRDGKIVKKKVKGFKARKFKAPDFMKVLPNGDE